MASSDPISDEQQQDQEHELGREQRQQQQQHHHQPEAKDSFQSRKHAAVTAFLSAYGWQTGSDNFNASAALLWVLRHESEEPSVVAHLIRNGAELFFELNETTILLQKCVAKDHVATTKLLLGSISRPHSSHISSILASLLCLALMKGYGRMCLCLLEAGASPHMHTADGFCALSIAVRSNLTKVVRHLLNSGAELSTSGQRHFASCLLVPILEDNVELLELLEKASVPISNYFYTRELETLLCTAARAKSVDVIKHLLTNYPSIFLTHRGDIHDALFLTIESKDATTFEALMSAASSVDIEARDRSLDETMLWHAVRRKDRNIAVSLLQRGANINTRCGIEDSVYRQSLLDRIMRWDPSILEHSPYVEKPNATIKFSSIANSSIVSSARTSMDKGSRRISGSNPTFSGRGTKNVTATANTITTTRSKKDARERAPTPAGETSTATTENKVDSGCSVDSFSVSGGSVSVSVGGGGGGSGSGGSGGGGDNVARGSNGSSSSWLRRLLPLNNNNNGGGGSSSSSSSSKPDELESVSATTATSDSASLKKLKHRASVLSMKRRSQRQQPHQEKQPATPTTDSEIPELPNINTSA